MPSALPAPPAASPSVTLLRYMDITVLVALAPIVVFAGLPLAGYLIAAFVWIVARYAVETGNRAAARRSNPGQQAAIMLSVRMGRTAAIVVALLVARFAFGNDDGVMAAAVSLGAFTLRLLIILALRGDQPARREVVS